ncbi:MAG TPA: ABC transporter permease [Candidatus Acidoferrum sp.]|jgi:predicted permease
MELWQDLRHATRLLRLNPGFTAVAVLSLALGIGANTAIFQLIDSVRLAALPVNNPQELTVVRIAVRKWSSGNFQGRYSQLSNPLWEQIRDHQQAFSSIFAWSGNTFNLSTGGEARYAQGIYISGDFFKVLEIQPMLGRLLTSEDDRPGCGTPGAVISYNFWQREFAGRPFAIGSKLSLEGHPVSVIGITPPGFFGVEIGSSYDIAVPICSEPAIRGENSVLNMRHGWWLAAMGRLKPGWTLEKASAQLNAISTAALEATVPPVYKPDQVKKYMAYRLAAFPAENGFSSMRREYENPLWTLLVIAGLVLLIACANLANLMLARASAREREVAVRIAMGASRARLLRQLFVESLLLAGIGAALGIALSQLLSRFLVAFLSTQDSPVSMKLLPDWRVLAFTAGLAVLTCLIFGLAPALRSTRVAPSSVLKSAGRGMTSTRERFGLRRILVVSQVALSLVLLVGALLFVRTLRNLTTLDPGFRQSGMLVANLDFTQLNIPADHRQQFKHDLLDRLRAIPGIESAADASIVPIAGDSWNEDAFLEGDPKRPIEPWFDRVSPGYFQTLHTPFLAGRDFNDHDSVTSPAVAIVNETFVRKFLNGQNAVGVNFQIATYIAKSEPLIQIVGVVKDAKYADLREDPIPVAFVTTAQDLHPGNSAQFLISSNLPSSAILPTIKDTILQSGPSIGINFSILQEQIRLSLLRERLMATLSGFFGFLAVLLAVVGLYGVISYTVARRTNEIGIRVAFGAQRGHVIKMIMREAGLLLILGLIAGSAISLAAARTTASLLYGLKPHDPLTLVAAIIGLAIVAAIASFLPAHRASRLDPMHALREE